MQKLFKVQLIASVYVVAKDAEQAEDLLSEMDIDAILDSNSVDVDATHVKSQPQFDLRDAEDSVFNMENHEFLRETAGEYLAQWLDHEKKRPLTRKELAAAGQQNLTWEEE